MSATDVVRSMRARVPWPVAGHIFRSYGLQRARGWRRTVAKAEAGDAAFEEAETELESALEEHHCCGEKLVRLFRPSAEELASLKARIAALEVPANAFSAVFPSTLTEAELRNFRGHPPALASKLEYTDGTAIVLASARYLMSREQMLPAELPDAAAAELGEFEEIICVRHQRLEGMDVLWVPNNGEIIEVRTDFPLGMHIRSGIAAIDQAVNSFGEIFTAAPFLAQINLFPAVQALYAARGEGRMVELGFMTSGAAQKLEKTRRDLDCCREEAYHLGGVDALDEPILPFRVSVLWQVNIDEGVTSQPEITLRGTSVQTADPNAFLGEMVVRNCTGFADYEFARDRVLNLLS